MNIDRKKLLKELTERLIWCENYVYEKARCNPFYVRVLEMKETDLPLHINDGGLIQELVEARLKGEDIDTPVWYTKVMCDVDMSETTYGLGQNDGELGILNLIFKRLMAPKLAERALMAQYNLD